MISKLAFSLILFGLASEAFGDTTTEFRNRVNMAMRQIGHELLLEKGDSTSVVPKVEYQGPNGFLLPLEQSFNYGSLPFILEKAMADHGISESYELVVQECDTELPFLGFNKQSFENGDVPCQTREGMQDCANIFIQFDLPETTQNQESDLGFLLWLIFPLIGGIGFLFYRRSKNEHLALPAKGGINLGDYIFDPQNQVLLRGNEKANLTFRENKLLHLFASRPNEVLTREEILGSVWEDEGVIVGRSMDVFISRLRKLLKTDPRVQIKNVHGVGYKLEISNS
jgi:hypothetical protein